MMCKRSDIKELLPAYVGKELEPGKVKTLEAHVALCGDCRSELLLLQMLSEEKVPDPGPAFWDDVPVSIEREVRNQKKKAGSLRDLLAGWPIPRWSWAPIAATAVVIFATWIAFRPVPPEMQRSAGETEYEQEDSVTVAELTPTQLAAASQWAQDQLAPIGEAINEEATENVERSSFEDIVDLSSEELDRLDKLLREHEQKVKKRVRQKQRNEKNIG